MEQILIRYPPRNSFEQLIIDVFQPFRVRLGTQLAHQVQRCYPCLLLIIYHHQTVTVVVQNRLHQLFLHHVQASLVERLVKTVEDYFYAVGSHTGMEVECIFRWRANPLGDFLEVCQTCTQTDESEFLYTLAILVLDLA
jgi:hypothetical protein